MPLPPDPPFVSIIMPIRNEADFIAEALGAVLAQDYPHERMEVIVADGQSTDGTPGIAARTASAHPNIAFTLIENPGRIVPVGLNAAIRCAKGEIIVRVDGHCKIAPDYVSRCVAHLLNEGVEGVGGPITTIAEGTVGEAIAAAMSSAFGVGGSAFRTVRDKTMLVDTVAFPAYTRAALDLAGPFDEMLVRNQDDEYNYRLRKLGGKILLAADVRSEYYARTSLSKLWRQYYQYGYYKVRVMQKHPRQMSARQFIPPLFVAGLIGGAVLAFVHPVFRWLWLAGIGAYGLGALGAAVITARQAGWRLLPILPITFAILHVAYGLGFLVGLVRFAGQWGRDDD
jgi:succinoglycan biosynthesis protein ExoA